MNEFADGVARLTLSQRDLSKAVEFWLNSCILKNPVTVIDFEESKTNFSSTFSIGLLEVPPEGCFENKNGSYILIADGKVQTWAVPRKDEEGDEQD